MFVIPEPKSGRGTPGDKNELLTQAALIAEAVGLAFASPPGYSFPLRPGFGGE